MAFLKQNLKGFFKLQLPLRETLRKKLTAILFKITPPIGETKPGNGFMLETLWQR